MKTNDIILVALGFVVGYFVKSNLDRRNAVMTTPSEENFVFSQKYKNCETKAIKSLNEINANINYLEVKKGLIDSCMKAV